MKFKILTLLFFAVTAGLWSCKKGDDSAPPLDVNPPNVSTINATADTLNVYQNGTRQNNTSNIYPGGATSYLPFINGAQNISLKKAGNPNALFSKSFNISSGQYYSLFVTGTSAGDIFETIDPIDTTVAILDTSATTQAMIRFVNASPAAGAITVTVGSTVNFQNIASATVTAFTPFDASVPREVKVFLPNTTNAIIDSTIFFQTQIIYTLYTKGSPTGTGNSAFSLNLMNNPYIPKNQ